jgi:putative transcriptional regulator
MKWGRIMKLRSQAEIAEMVGVARQTISTTENGHTVPSVTLALAIARVLDATVEELWGDVAD